MATVRIEVVPGEARTLRAMLDERAQLLNMIQGAVQMICARNGIPAALFSGVDGDDGIVLEIPDGTDFALEVPPAKPDRPESSETGAAVVGAISTAPEAETPSESTPAGEKGHSKPVVEAPDVGIPAGDGAIPSRGPFHHVEGA